MTPLSPIHPVRAVKPGRYLLDETGMLWTPIAPLPFRMVAAVVVKPKAGKTDDVRAPADKTDNPVESPVEILGTTHVFSPIAAPSPHRHEPPMRSMARREKPTAVQGFQALIDADDDVENVDLEFRAKLKAVQARRSTQSPTKANAPIDGKRIAAVYRAKSMKAVPEPKVPTERALSREACWQCGIPGARGCEHQLPYQGAAS